MDTQDLEKEVMALRELLKLTSDEKNRAQLELGRLKNKLDIIRKSFASLVFVDVENENS